MTKTTPKPETAPTTPVVVQETPAQTTPAPTQTPTDTPEPIDYTAYYTECQNRLKAPESVDYLKSRGITVSAAQIYHLGYDPEWVSPTVVRNQRRKGSDWTPEPTPRIIIPVSSTHYVACSVKDDRFPVMQETGGGPTGILGLQYLGWGEECIYVVQDAMDALAVAEGGRFAVALNGSSNATRLTEYLHDHPTRSKLIICPHDDSAGRKVMQTLVDGLREISADYAVADLCCGHHDPGMALMTDPAAFFDAVLDAPRSVVQEIIDPTAADSDEKRLAGKLTPEEDLANICKAGGNAIKIPRFPKFSEMAKIQPHDTVILAADTGVGKSSMALNWTEALIDEYPVMYCNLEMDQATPVQRLVAIHANMPLDDIERINDGPMIRERVQGVLEDLYTKHDRQMIEGVYDIAEIENHIRVATQNRTEPTVVFIDTGLLVRDTSALESRYARFTATSEKLRAIALRYNIVMVILLQQNRTGKADGKRPTNASLKESGSWENDACKVIFLWEEPDGLRKLIVTKNRKGMCGEILLTYTPPTQRYDEMSDLQIVQYEAAKKVKEPEKAEKKTKTDKAKTVKVTKIV